MSQPGDELLPLPPEQPPKSGLSRSPYIALGVAAVVVSTAFATVAAMSSGSSEEAAPERQSNDTSETYTQRTDTTDATTTTPTTTPTTPTSTTTTPTTTTTTTTKKTTTDPADPPPSPTTTTTTTPPPPPNKPPNAAASGGPCTINVSCSFSADGSSDPEGGPLTYSWNFGDGGSSSSKNPSHTFTTAGTFTVVVTVRDNKGANDTASVTIEVAPAGTTSG